jgi:hypothetical protein
MTALFALLIGIILVIILIWGFSVIETIIPSGNGIMNEIIFKIVGGLWIGIVIGIPLLITIYLERRKKAKKPPDENSSHPNT